MEEKERYKTIYHNYTNPEDNWMSIFDNETGKDLDNDADFEAITNLLNQQDKRIKELEEELDDAKRDYIPKLEFGLQRANKMGRDAEKENQQLKQQLHDLPKKIVGEIRNAIWEGCREYYDAEEDGIIQYTEITPNKVNKILDTILKKYGGENE